MCRSKKVYQKVVTSIVEIVTYQKDDIKKVIDRKKKYDIL
ncbi:hypothetical protein lbkm_0306 [Lachnospiraceae bacterium KM106-2]|nr:hypothetical protein lbkm_0306 [Lachnospiraceae bacterium KM106-2]